jgi:integrase
VVSGIRIPVAGEKSYSANSVYEKHLVPAGKQIGVQLSWHTFRHTYRTWLDEVGTPMGIMQKLMRHSDICTTMNVYGGAMQESLRTANSKVVEIAFRGTHRSKTG